MNYLNTTVLRANEKEMPSKIKTEENENAFKNGILSQKYEDKKTILFGSNYKIEKDKLKIAYNIQNRGVDVFDQYLEISSIQIKLKNVIKKFFYLVLMFLL